jgi:C-terminal processing protease CtpA/Prc
MRKRIAQPLALLITATLILSACSTSLLRRPSVTPTTSIDLPSQTQDQLSDFDLLVRAIQTQYINDTALGADWQSAVNTYRSQVSQGLDSDQFYEALSHLLDTLHDEDLLLVRPRTRTTSATVTITATLSGIGVLAALPEPSKDRLLILSVYPGSPAEEAQLQAHDAIVKIDGQPVTYAGRADVLSSIPSASGTRVKLTVRTPGKTERDVQVTRQPLTNNGKTVARRIANTNIGYLLPSFDALDVARLDIAQSLRDLSEVQTPDGLILDLRTAQSDDFPLNELLALFTNGQVGTGYTRSGSGKLVITGRNVAGSQEIPLVLLVSDQTRGPAEAFAGILQDLGRVRIAGFPTPGRAEISLPVALPNTGIQVLIPAGGYRGQKDKGWYHKGVQPDIPSNQTWESYTDADDPQLPQAVQALTR